MRRGRRFCRATLEVCDADDLKVLIGATVRKIASVSFPGFVEKLAQCSNVRERVRAPSMRRGLGCWTFVFDRQLPQVAIRNADNLGCFGGRESAKRLFCFRWEEL